MFDERTPYLDLRLPNLTNPLNVDVDRLRETITLIDQYAQAIAQSRGLALGDATLDSTGKVPASQLPEMLATGVMMDYALSTLPSDGWRFCNGDALLSTDTLAASLRAKLIADGSVFGADGDGNPKVPDYRGRGGIGRDNMGGTAAGRVTTAGSGIDGKTLGAAGGEETHLLATTEMPGHAHGITDPGHNHAVTDPGHAHSVYDPGHTHLFGASFIGSGTGSNGGYVAAGGSNVATIAAATGISIYAAVTGISIQAKVTGITINNTGGGAAHNNMQPSLVVNKIIKL